MAASWIQEFTLLILDLADVSKKHARRMEYTMGIHGGNEDAGTMIMITPLRAGRPKAPIRGWDGSGDNRWCRAGYDSPRQWPR
jgi:hypothetical protein